MRKLLFCLIIMMPISTFSFTEEFTEKFDKANQLFLDREYEKALPLYQELQAGINEKDLKDNLEITIFTDIKRSVKEAELLVKYRVLLENMKLAAAAENDAKYSDSLALLIKTREYVSAAAIGKVPYIEDILAGRLEERILVTKKENLGNFSYTYVEKVKNDKKRKKSIVFFDFIKDPKVEFDIQKIVLQNLFKVLENRASFRISDFRPDKNKSTDEQIAEAREQKIDLVFFGEYKKNTANTILLSFYVIDPLKKQKLIEASIRASLDMDFFDTIDKIAADLEKNLRDYSTLENFAIIKYMKEQGKKLVKQEASEEQTLLLPALEDKIIQLLKKSIAYLRQQVENEEPGKQTLTYFSLISQEIDSVNRLQLKEKFSLEENVLKFTPRINASFRKSHLKSVLNKMAAAREEREIDDYKEAYLELKKEFPTLYQNYAQLKLPLETLEKELASEYDATLKESLVWEAANPKFKKGIKLYAGSGSLGSGGIFLQYRSFELMLAGGAVLTTGVSSNLGIPLTARLSFYLIDLKILEPYVFAGYIHPIPVKNYVPRDVFVGGAGTMLFKFFYGEISYILSKSDYNTDFANFTAGLGIKIGF